jgi:hypothetical protein
VPNEAMRSRALPQSAGVATRAVMITVAGFLVFVALAMAGLFLYLRTEAPDALNKVVQHQFPAPALQTDPQDDLKRFLSEQKEQLSGYHWIDRAQGVVRIPIEEAMRIIAARGDHAYDALDPPLTPANSEKPDGARP